MSNDRSRCRIFILYFHLVIWTLGESCAICFKALCAMPWFRFAHCFLGHHSDLIFRWCCCRSLLFKLLYFHFYLIQLDHFAFMRFNALLFHESMYSNPSIDLSWLYLAAILELSLVFTFYLNAVIFPWLVRMRVLAPALVLLLSWFGVSRWYNTDVIPPSNINFSQAFAFFRDVSFALLSYATGMS